jgi:hypothetical protein
MKAILIDVEAKEVREVEYSGDLDAMKSLIKCQYVDRVSASREVDIWVDDEGLCNGKTNGFLLGKSQSPLMGNGLVTGMNRQTGETTEVTVTIEQVTGAITFIDYDDASLVPEPKITITTWK